MLFHREALHPRNFHIKDGLVELILNSFLLILQGLSYVQKLKEKKSILKLYFSLMKRQSLLVLESPLQRFFSHWKSLSCVALG